MLWPSSLVVFGGLIAPRPPEAMSDRIVLEHKEHKNEKSNEKHGDPV